MCPPVVCFFFFNDTATTEIYTLSLHDALPISARRRERLHLSPRFSPAAGQECPRGPGKGLLGPARRDRKSTRLNSSHANISYAVFCLKKKNKHAIKVASRSGINHGSVTGGTCN